MAIKINAEEMKAKAGTIRSLKQNHDDEIKTIGTTIRELCNTDSFDGQAASAYLARFESMAGTFTSFSEMLESLAVSLEQTATTMTEVDSGLASSISNQ